MCGIMSLTDAKYGKFVDNLDNSQAILLRASGGAVVPVVQALAGGGALQQRPLKLENTTVNDIMRCLKGSPVLLGLVSRIN